MYVPVCVCVCDVFPFIPDVRLVDLPAGVTQEEGHTELLIHLPYAVLALVFLARRVQSFLSLVDQEVEFLCTNELTVLHLLGVYNTGIYLYQYIYIYILVRKNLSSCDCTGIQTHVPRSECFEVTN